jgi:hypothetical protein
MLTPEKKEAIEKHLQQDSLMSDQSLADIHQTTGATVKGIRQKLIYNRVIKETFKRRGTDGKTYSLPQASETKVIVRPTVCVQGVPEGRSRGAGCLAQ